MMIRGDQHVDDWAEVAVDYLDGQLDQNTRLAVEAHLSGCPECAVRLRKQQYVVRFLQESVLDDPPEDLEYRSIGEMVFPSPGGDTITHPVKAKKPALAPRWHRELRAWAVPLVAFVALIAAVTGYGIARSGSDANIAKSTDRVAGATTTAAGAATTAAPFSEASVAGAAQTVTTAAAATTTTALLAAAPSTDATFSTLPATQDPKAMVRALQTAQAPTFVSFQTAVPAPPVDDQGTTGTGAPTDTTAAGTTETTVPGTPTTAGGTPDTTAATVAGNTTGGTVSADKAAALLDEIKQFTGLEPVDQSLWVGGPTFAVFLPREDASELVDLVRSISSSFGLTVSLQGTPPSQLQEACTRLLDHKSSFPVLAAHRALQPSTWSYDFTTSTLGSDSANGQTGGAKALPDEAGTHVVVVIWIEQ
jgi:anti-sigma factor RsiW